MILEVGVEHEAAALRQEDDAASIIVHEATLLDAQEFTEALNLLFDEEELPLTAAETLEVARCALRVAAPELLKQAAAVEGAWETAIVVRYRNRDVPLLVRLVPADGKKIQAESKETRFLHQLPLLSRPGRVVVAALPALEQDEVQIVVTSYEVIVLNRPGLSLRATTQVQDLIGDVPADLVTAEIAEGAVIGAVLVRSEDERLLFLALRSGVILARLADDGQCWAQDTAAWPDVESVRLAKEGKVRVQACSTEDSVAILLQGATDAAAAELCVYSLKQRESSGGGGSGISGTLGSGGLWAPPDELRLRLVPQGARTIGLRYRPGTRPGAALLTPPAEPEEAARAVVSSPVRFAVPDLAPSSSLQARVGSVILRAADTGAALLVPTEAAVQVKRGLEQGTLRLSAEGLVYQGPGGSAASVDGVASIEFFGALDGSEIMGGRAASALSLVPSTALLGVEGSKFVVSTTSMSQLPLADLAAIPCKAAALYVKARAAPRGGTKATPSKKSGEEDAEVGAQLQEGAVALFKTQVESDEGTYDFAINWSLTPSWAFSALTTARHTAEFSPNVNNFAVAQSYDSELRAETLLLLSEQLRMRAYQSELGADSEGSRTRTSMGIIALNEQWQVWAHGAVRHVSTGRSVLLPVTQNCFLRFVEFSTRSPWLLQYEDGTWTSVKIGSVPPGAPLTYQVLQSVSLPASGRARAGNGPLASALVYAPQQSYTVQCDSAGRIAVRSAPADAVLGEGGALFSIKDENMCIDMRADLSLNELPWHLSSALRWENTEKRVVFSSSLRKVPPDCVQLEIPTVFEGDERVFVIADTPTNVSACLVAPSKTLYTRTLRADQGLHLFVAALHVPVRLSVRGILFVESGARHNADELELWLNQHGPKPRHSEWCALSSPELPVPVGSCLHLQSLSSQLLEDKDACLILLDDEYGYWAGILVTRVAD